MLSERCSGILLHPTSLPSRGGIGDFGPAAHDFVEFLAASRQRLWQILPFGPGAYGHSPYSSISAFAGNPLLISLERLAEHGWLDSSRVESLPRGQGDVDFNCVDRVKIPLIRDAAAAFLRKAGNGPRERFERFCRENAWWLEDFVLFVTLRERFQSRMWSEWPSEFAHRESNTLANAREEMRDALDIARVVQFFFFEQWSAVRAHCQRYGIRVIGDVAIFVNYDSADVWTHPDIFRLDQNLQPEVVAGVPPDLFSSTGQRWGNPLYRWDVLARRGYDWWIERMRWATQTCDIVRLDHFRGFESYWEIPANEETAVHGAWVKGPADDLFRALRDALGDLPFIAEDLGMITEEVHALRERLKIPGMRVMQFGFSNPGAHIYLPHKFSEDCVAYTGTHDNDTTVGWWNSASDDEHRYASSYLGSQDDGVAWALIRAISGSVARFAVFPLQDVLGLDANARMNTPSKPNGNWGWRFCPGALTPQIAEKLAVLAEITDRVPKSADSEQRNGEVGEDFAA
jgi:4-alpha-glucanotransferase